MKIWKLPEPGRLTTEEKLENIEQPDQVKVRITNVLISPSDLRVYNGDEPANLPIIPCRFAVGIVSDRGRNCYVEKNTRVYIADSVACGRCEACLEGKSGACQNMQTAGTDRDGYLREFIITKENNLSPLPPTVSDSDALFTGMVSLCEAVISRLDADKGSHIAVFGANEIGNILCQLLIYHQIVPILIDVNDRLLDLARDCGIYYTIKADENLLSRLSEITGGRMADASVFMSFSPMASDLPYETTAAGGNVIYAGFEFPAAQASLKAAQDRRLTITTITNDYSNRTAAINLLANKALRTAPLKVQVFRENEAEKVFAERSAAIRQGEIINSCILKLM